jgi:hypothetical protein
MLRIAQLRKQKINERRCVSWFAGCARMFNVKIAVTLLVAVRFVN